MLGPDTARWYTRDGTAITERGVSLRLIEPSQPNQNAFIKSRNGRLRGECLNEHGFTSLPDARAVIEAWRREYNVELAKNGLGGLTPAQYAQPLTEKRTALTAGL